MSTSQSDREVDVSLETLKIWEFLIPTTMSVGSPWFSGDPRSLIVSNNLVTWSLRRRVRLSAPPDVCSDVQVKIRPNLHSQAGNTRVLLGAA